MNLNVKLGMDVSGFTRSMANARREAKTWAQHMQDRNREAQASASKWRNVFAGITSGITAATYAMTRFVKTSLDAGGAIQDAADRMGVPAMMLQSWQAQAEDAGVGIDAVRAAWDKLAATLGEARDGNEDMISSLERLGITAEDIKSGGLLDIWNQLQSTIRATKVSSAGGQFLADLRKVYGRGGTAMVPFAKSRKPSIDQLNSNATTASLDAAGDSLKGVGRFWRAFKNDLVEGLLTKPFQVYRDNPSMPGIWGKILGAINPNPTDIISGGEYTKRLQEQKILGEAEREALRLSESKDDADKAKKDDEKAQKEAEQKRKELEDAKNESLKAERELLYSRLESELDQIAFIKGEMRIEEGKRNTLQAGTAEHLASGARLNAMQKEVEDLQREANKKREEAAKDAAEEYTEEQKKIKKDEEERLKLRIKRQEDAWEFNKPNTDSLIDVGNYLGSNGNVTRPLEFKLDQIKQELITLQKISTNNGRKTLSIPST